MDGNFLIDFHKLLRAEKVTFFEVFTLFSGINKKNGIINKTYQIAVNGPTALVPSRTLTSNPNTGGFPKRVCPALFSAKNNKVIKSNNKPPT